MIKLLLLIATQIGLQNPSLLPAICSVESDFRNVINHYDGGSPSYGICQIKLATAQDMLPDVTAEMLMEPVINAYVAGLYLKYHEKRYEAERFIKRETVRIKQYGKEACVISAYNAGRCINSNQDTYVKKVYERIGKI
jgi:hypothetical protein